MVSVAFIVTGGAGAGLRGAEICTGARLFPGCRFLRAGRRRERRFAMRFTILEPARLATGAKIGSNILAICITLAIVLLFDIVL